MLTAEIQDAINRAEQLPFATATPEGIPNVVPVKYVWVAAPDTLWIADNYFDKTLANLRANSQAALYAWSTDPKLCVQIKGDATLHTEGADYEAMRGRARAEKPDIPARSLVKLRVREIFQCLPGDGPGRRLWPSVAESKAETAS